MAESSYPSLLVTRLYIPRRRAVHVSRAPLLRMLDAGAGRRLILIAAAAGSGKTMLVAEWSAARSQQVAWLSLDSGDNDPSRFLSYVIAAIQTRHPHIGQELLAALQSPQPPAAEFAMRSLINQLAGLAEPLFLVLDDYHVIENQAVHAALAFFLEYAPPDVTLIMLTRTDPPLPLARLRAGSDLLEIRAAALRFSVNETTQFLNDLMQFQLPSDAIRALDARTEGWIAGLQLAAIAMQSLPGDRRAFIESFTGSHRFVLDYLIEEVLSHQPDNVRRFLLHTSLLHRMNASLCSAVSGESDGQAMMDYLERNNLFLVPLDGSRGWYRYHHLFAGLLQARLQVESPELVPELQRRAARWYEAANLPEESVEYALAAGDFDDAARMMTGAGSGVMRRGEVTTLLAWYRAFPPNFLAQHPELCLQFGMAFALNGRWNDAETLLNDAERSSAAPPDERLMLAYLVASHRQSAARLEAIAAEASARSDPMTRLVQGLLASLTGDFQSACRLIAEAQEMSERRSDMSLALAAQFHRCRYLVYLGDLRATYELCQQAAQHGQIADGSALPMTMFTHTSSGRVLIEWNEPERAAQHLQEAIRLAELSGFVTGIMSSATMMLAETKQALGDSAAANELAQAAIAHAERNDPPPEVIWLKTYQARLWLLQGNLAAAGDWLNMAQKQPFTLSLFYPTTIQKITQARVYLAQRKTTEALNLLTRLMAEPRHLLTVEILCVLAVARQAHGDIHSALLTLEQALTLAEADNRLRVFVEQGAPMAKLLARYLQEHPEHAFARSLLTLFPTDADSALIELPGERELEILRLIAAGHSNDEIAQHLSLALSTVKWYINGLYGRLHVKSRTQAVARARELHLVD